MWGRQDCALRRDDGGLCRSHGKGEAAAETVRSAERASLGAARAHLWGRGVKWGKGIKGTNSQL